MPVFVETLAIATKTRTLQHLIIPTAPNSLQITNYNRKGILPKKSLMTHKFYSLNLPTILVQSFKLKRKQESREDLVRAHNGDEAREG